jgi:restriction system protein
MIPDYQTCMLPVLKAAEDGKEHHVGEMTDQVSDYFSLSPAERKELLPSGRQEVIRNRVGWATTYMKKAGLLKSSRRAHYEITDAGKAVLDQRPKKINVKFLEQFDGFQDFREKSRESQKRSPSPPKEPDYDDVTPEELIETGFQKLQGDLVTSLLESIADDARCSPSFFEKLVVDLLVRMGYGGSRRDAGAAIGASGDEGIDGIIKEDKLGLDVVYVQAKKWANSVGRPEIQKFAGALQGQRARKGIFITTSTFTQGAREYVLKIESKIILIDGEELANLMIEHGVGVTTSATYEVKKVEETYFSGE